ncbi:prevent-host-death family protein [Calothrix sp. NIES-4071]|nr:prevent-host-death family protein [Calothrix sp. NIES-4071]BAZ63960.1 prevent-host-death family protein [Calothrix sp. NIES-4105]
MKWTFEEAQDNLSLIIDATNQEPQLIYTQEQLVAAIVDPKLFQEFLNWQQQRSAKPSLTKAFAELRQLCIQEDYSLEIPTRSVKPNPLTEFPLKEGGKCTPLSL